MFIGKTDSRRPLTISLSVSSALLGLVVFVLLSAAPATIYAAELAPFSTDGCSLFPEGSGENSDLWLSCCRAHDLSYWRGGTRAERKAADDALEQCVAAKGYPKVAALMSMGVFVGGTPFLPTPFRWGYGWPYPRGYGVLSTEEEAQVARNLGQKTQQKTQQKAK